MKKERRREIVEKYFGIKPIEEFIDYIEQEAKREMIDDYETEWEKGNPLSPNEMRKHHLSTLPKTDDECSFCEGTGFPKGQQCIDIKKRQSNIIADAEKSKNDFLHQKGKQNPQNHCLSNKTKCGKFKDNICQEFGGNCIAD